MTTPAAPRPPALRDGYARVDLLLVGRRESAAGDGPSLVVRRRRDEEQVGGTTRHRATEVVADEGGRRRESAGLGRRHVRIPGLERRTQITAERRASGAVELNGDVDAGIRAADVCGDRIVRRARQPPVVEGDSELAVRRGEHLLLE